ncbi:MULTISPECIES: hypothetical protein [Alcanivorax]|uniref:hypothetical protein n=1 Tax=Alcanivorax TaxID=59753 RepID=UPI001060C136|nr:MULTISPECIES: hypothetical protein [Alcanivorax]
MSSTSYGYSVARDRWRIVGPPELLALVLLIGVVCWLVFPRDLAGSLRSARMDAVTLSYTNAWLRAKPDDFGVRLVLARNLMDLGLLQQAEEQLDHLSRHASDPSTLATQAWLRSRLPFVALMEIPARQRRDDPLWGQSRAALERVDRTTLSLRQLERYAEMALILDLPDAAVQAYRQLAARQAYPGAWYARGAAALLARGQYREAADEYLLAMASQENHYGRRRYFLAALSSLESGGLIREAAALGQREAAPFLNDQKVLYRLMNMARAAGEYQLAERYAILLLKLDQGLGTP